MARRRIGKKNHPAAERRRDPLDAVPVIAPNVEARADAQSRMQVRRPVEPGSRAARWLARVFNIRRAIRVNLDEQGSAYWRLIDGRRDLRAVAAALAAEYAMEEEEGVKATLMFTKMLMLRRLILLRIGEEAESS